MTWKLAALAALISALAVTSADARTRHQTSNTEFILDRHTVGYSTIQIEPIVTERRRRTRIKRMRDDAPVHRAYAKHEHSHEAQIVAHPTGCPSRSFCGCGASVEVFGHSVRDLWLAANWFKFPRAAAAPGMVAVRRHHVFVIRQVLGNGLVLAYDANSGNHKTRIHPRSLAGYTVVDPRGGSRYAGA